MPKNGDYDWATATYDDLHRLYIIEKRTGSAIARLFGGGLTRNAVMGKLNRLGLKRARSAAEAPPSASVRPPQKVMKPAPRPRAEPAVPPAKRVRKTPPAGSSAASDGTTEAISIPPPSVRGPTGLLQAVQALEPGLCKAPSEDAEPASPDFSYCNAPVEGGGSYCAYHARLFYRAPDRRRRD